MTHRKYLNVALVALFTLTATAFATGTALAGDDTQGQTTLTIKGMTCGGCTAAVKAQLKKTPGVESYEVSLDRGEADVSFDASVTDPETIAASVSKTGFKATVKGEQTDKAQGGDAGDGAENRS